MQAVALRRKPGLLEQGDEFGQFPERHRIGRGEALLDLRRGQAGRQLHLAEWFRGLAGNKTLTVLDPPKPPFERRRARLDPSGELGTPVQKIDADIAQPQVGRGRFVAVKNYLPA